MRGVAGVLPLNIRPLTLAAAVGLAAFCVAAAFFIANAIVSSHVLSPGKPSARALATVAPELSQSAAPKAESVHRKTALPRIEAPATPETRLAPDPSRLGAPRQAPQDEASRAAALRAAPQREDGRAPAETGRASWYDLDAKTASGEAMNGAALTAAHPSLPFGSKVSIANLDNGRSVVVRINDRGPFTKDRIIDVSKAAAEKLGMIAAGVARVSVSPVEGEIAGAIEASAEAPLRR